MRKQQKIHEIVKLLKGEFPEEEKPKARHSFGNVLEINAMTPEEMGKILVAEDYLEGLNAIPDEEIDVQILEWKNQGEVLQKFR